MKKTLEEILGAVKTILGDNTSDEAISLIEDITDSFAPTGSEAADEWEKRYNELDKEWRTKYTERFYSGKPEPETIREPETEQPEKPLKFEDLFTEGEKK